MKKVLMILILLMMVFIIFEANTVSASLPGKTTITLLNEPSDGYHIGDTVEVLCVAEKGWGGDDIAKFTLEAYYGNLVNTLHESSKNAIRTGDGGYKAQFSFTLTEKQGDYLTIEGRAFDTQRLPGVKGVTAIHVSQKTYSNPYNGDNGNNNDVHATNTDKTPGFELVFVLIAFSLLITWKTKKKA